ncbi:MAG: hypothetical protein ACJ75B_11895 [Flavisolibacter sp.]
MKPARSIILILSICLSGLAHGQQNRDSDSSFVLIRTIEGDIADVAMDNMDNLYVISSSGQVKKFNAAGDSIAIYNQVMKFGKPFSIDVSNPLKILLFYKNFSTVVVLDRLLAPLATIDLRKFSILQPGAVGLSYDNNIWVFDEYDNKLKKINEQGDHLLETADLRNIFNESLQPQRIMSDYGKVYLADTATGIFVFDNYGSFRKKIPVKNWHSLVVSGNNLVSTNDEMVTVYNTATLMQTQKKTPLFEPYFHSFITSDHFVYFSNKSLRMYRWRWEN